MDPKATAKSKRSHTQHGRRTHLPPAAIAHKKKAAASASASASSSSGHRNFSSNWDRYDDDDSNQLEISNFDGSRSAEIVARSKGADFGWLIEQARSQPKDFGSHVSQSSDSADDFSLGNFLFLVYLVCAFVLDC